MTYRFQKDDLVFYAKPNPGLTDPDDIVASAAMNAAIIGFPNDPSDSIDWDCIELVPDVDSIAIGQALQVKLLE